MLMKSYSSPDKYPETHRVRMKKASKSDATLRPFFYIVVFITIFRSGCFQASIYPLADPRLQGVR